MLNFHLFMVLTIWYLHYLPMCAHINLTNHSIIALEKIFKTFISTFHMIKILNPSCPQYWSRGHGFIHLESKLSEDASKVIKQIATLYFLRRFFNNFPSIFLC